MRTKKRRTKTKAIEKSEIDKSFELNSSESNNSLTNGLETQLFGYEKEFRFLSQIVDNILVKGESNSILICGGPGSGKTTLLQSYLHQIESDPNISIIHLNGFINSNDLNTIKIIGRHLKITANTITDIMKGLKTICEENPNFRVIIILDRFDIFCRRNQTLLYNLLDVLQQSKSICIIGMTNRLDSIDLLEKRVKSRLNQRIIQLIAPFNNFEEYIKFSLKLLNRNKIDDSLRESLKILYSKDFSVKELKCLLSEYKVSEITGLELCSKDTKMLALTQLSKYEISVLLIANKYTKNQNKTEFNCNAIMNALRHLPQIKINQKMLFKVIYKLLETDLISRVSAVKNNELLLSEWTQFRLNIDDSHLNNILSSNSFPNYLKQI